jgi:hypothetical protein
MKKSRSVSTLALSVLLVVVPVTALQAMNVAVFLQKADALQKKGMAAMFSSDIGLLKTEIRTDSAALKAERDAARRAGRPQPYCPPTKASLNSNEILASFRAIPPAQRSRTEVKDALRTLLARKYPCRS